MKQLLGSSSLFALISVVFLAFSPTASAQLNSNTASVALTATLLEALTVTATPAAVTFNLNAGSTANGLTPVAITTAWVLSPTRSTVVLDGYFASASAALTDGGTPANNIPTSAVLGQVTTGSPTTFTAFTQTAALGPAGAGLTLFSQSITGTNRVSTRTDNLNLQINLSGVPQLPAGIYTGTLTIQAQAN
ncbi:MAG TPA: hypothetical protein VKX41_22635 [Alloacidobacterium sp.]|nr:hypothetical protein [Alloacidobacterium sp.]